MSAAIAIPHSSPLSPKSSTSSSSSPSISSTDDHHASNSNTADLEKFPTEASSASASQAARVRHTRTSSVKSLWRAPRGHFGHALSHVQTGSDVLVNFEGPDDPYSPMNWPLRKKIVTTVMYGLATACVTWASSIYSSAVRQIAADLDVSLTVALLGLALFLLGFGLGPMLWAPLSELFGRKPAVLIPFFISGIFSFATGSAKDIQTVLITRFFAGFFGAAPITNTGGALGDIWAPAHRGNAIVGYSAAVVGGPLLGPIAGAAITQSYLRWRYTEYITGIMIMAMCLADILIVDESYGPALLVRKARRLRHETNNWALHAKHEEWDVSLREMIHKYGARPFQLFVTPIAFCVALYASFVYGIVYLSFAAYPIIFEEGRGWCPVVGSLPFLALLVGCILGGGVNIYNNKFYIRRIKLNNNKAVPEARLPTVMFGSVSFAAGLFVLAWTSSPKIHWIAPMIGAVLIGAGFLTIFQGCLNYLIDTFQIYGASAIAANTFLRSIFAAAFPLFTTAMYHRLGTEWATSLLGFLATAMIPIPYLFYVFGPRIRKHGKFTAQLT